jgi:hypothetical protein
MFHLYNLSFSYRNNSTKVILSVEDLDKKDVEMITLSYDCTTGIVGSNFFWTRTRSIKLFRTRIRTRTRSIELFWTRTLPGPDRVRVRDLPDDLYCTTQENKSFALSVTNVIILVAFRDIL